MNFFKREKKEFRLYKIKFVNLYILVKVPMNNLTTRTAKALMVFLNKTTLEGLNQRLTFVSYILM